MNHCRSVIGGFLLHTFGRRTIFYVNLPIGLAALVLTDFRVAAEIDVTALQIEVE